MAFVKLDCGLLDSTLWADQDALLVFITALLMAEPKEYTAPVQQLSVRTLDATSSWSAPAGWYGRVGAAGAGIVRRAGLDIERGLAALERLGEPDLQSRSQDYDGRRMIRIDGGYLVLNFQKYRDRDYTAAERSKRYRLRQASRRDDRDVTRNVTQAEEEAEADSSVPSEPQKEEKENVRAWATKKYPEIDFDEERAAFDDYYGARGAEFADQDKALKSWIRKAAATKPKPRRSGEAGKPERKPNKFGQKSIADLEAEGVLGKFKPHTAEEALAGRKQLGEKQPF